ncbi:MAG: hypothetical protein AMXMBFR80_13990 [Dehalococcoidia bacterium]
MDMRLAVVAGASFTLALVLGECSGGEQGPGPTPGETAAPASATAQPTPSPAPDEPVRRTYQRGATVDAERGVLFLDGRTGGGEAWEAVRPSPSGMFVAWNGTGGKQPPMLIETDTYRRIELDTGGQPGTVLDYSPDDSEVSVRVGDEMLIVSTSTGAARLRFSLPPTTNFARATWGPGGRVAIARATRNGTSLGVAAWANGVMKEFPDAPANWAHWSPDGTRIAASGIHEGGWMAIIDFESGATTRVEQALSNPRWSASGEFLSGQLLSGEVLVYRADGSIHMRLNGVCALLGSPWIGDEIATRGFGEDVRVAMDGTVRPYAPAPPEGPVSTFLPHGVALLDRAGGEAIAELSLPDGVLVSWFSSSEGVHGVTADGRGMFQLGAGGKGWCENVGAFKVELAPFDE